MTFFPRVPAGTLQWGKAIFLPYPKSFNTVTKCRALAKPEEENRGQTVSCFVVRLGRKESKKGYGSERNLLNSQGLESLGLQQRPTHKGGINELDEYKRSFV